MKPSATPPKLSTFVRTLEPHGRVEAGVRTDAIMNQHHPMMGELYRRAKALVQGEKKNLNSKSAPGQGTTIEAQIPLLNSRASVAPKTKG